MTTPKHNKRTCRIVLHNLILNVTQGSCEYQIFISQSL